MVAEGTQYFQWWWIGTFPGLAIFTVVLAFNFLGDSLRDLFDPRTGLRRRDASDGRLLEVESCGCPAARRGLLTVGRRRRLPGRAGRGLRHRRRERQRQDDLGAVPARAAAARAPGRGRDPLRGQRSARAQRTQLRRSRAASSRWSSRIPMTSLHPMLAGRPQLTEHVRRHLGLSSRGPDRGRSSCSSRSGSPTRSRRCAPTRTSSPAACGSASRSRSRWPAGRAADRRRADDGARRHGAGRDPAAARPTPPRERPGRRADHARPRRDVGDRRPGLGLLRRPRRRVGPERARCSASPRHPYTRALLDALPHPEARRREPLVAIPGCPPSPGAVPPGCAFHPRCRYALPAARPTGRR